MDVETSFESERWFTQEEFARFCDRHANDLARYELLNGRIVMNPPSGWPQGSMSGLVAAAIGPFITSRKLGYIFGADQGFELPSGETVGPDAAFVSAARFRAAGPHRKAKFLRAVPDLVIEILSPSTASRDRGEKKAIYERNGVREYWLIDETKRNVTRFLLEKGRFGSPRIFPDDAFFTSVVLKGLRFKVAKLFP